MLRHTGILAGMRLSNPLYMRVVVHIDKYSTGEWTTSPPNQTISFEQI